MSFVSLGLAEWLSHQVEAIGFKEPTPVQKNCIPPIIKGQDCLGCAKTGSGKTAAFALPIINKLAQDPYGIFALVLTPTRELAYQISDQFRVFGKQIHLRDETVVGGVDMMKQAIALSHKPHVVIATPGRLADHLRSTDTLSLKKIKFLVLDEADRLLEPSFEEDLETIFEFLPAKRQTLLFSATLTDSLTRLQVLASNKPFFWKASAEVVTVETLDQRYVLMPAQVKDCYLVTLLDKLHDEENKSIILFTDTCRNCQIYGLLLKHLEFPCVTLHSLMSQGQRLASLSVFKTGKVKILVATDVASRGLDIPSVEIVLNINVPSSSKDYIHRVGRTARAGKGGVAITLMTQYDVARIKNIESDIKIQLQEYPVNESEALKHLNVVPISKREVDLRLRETDFGEKRKINKMKRKLVLLKTSSKIRKRKNY